MSNGLGNLTSNFENNGASPTSKILSSPIHLIPQILISYFFLEGDVV
jgi:hypothetical protein